MKRAIVAFLAGLATWILVGSLLDRGLRVAIEGYAAAEPKMTFTLGMQLARLSIGAITSLVTGAVIGWIARADVRPAWALGLLLLVAFIPVHVKLWNLFPIWYHLTFLVTLAPLIALGSWFVQAQRAATPAARHAGPSAT